MYLQKKFAITQLGQGNKILLMAHGYGCNQSMWRYILPHFEKNFKIVLYDLMGCGDSETQFYDLNKYSSTSKNGFFRFEIQILTDLSRLCQAIFRKIY